MAFRCPFFDCAVFTKTSKLLLRPIIGVFRCACRDLYYTEHRELHMTEIIMNPFHTEFMRLCEKADTSIKLCAPYVKYAIIDEIANKKQRTSKLSLITKMDLQNFHKHASDITAVKKTITIGGSVFNCSTLHAKFYIFDDMQCVITSANLTTSGFLRNVECGIYTDDRNLVNDAVKKYEQLALHEDVGKVSEQHITDIEGILTDLPSPSKIEYPNYEIPLHCQANIDSIAKRLTGWKKQVFTSLNQLRNDEFSSVDVSILADRLRAVFPKNHNPEAKIRQVLQQLRDIGLIQFIAPGKYKILWKAKDEL